MLRERAYDGTELGPVNLTVRTTKITHNFGHRVFGRFEIEKKFNSPRQFITNLGVSKKASLSNYKAQ